ncbi:uncharacterized protein LOC111407980 isoform X1 [Olea europaea var. sylvestris]|uniref:uncharacterized protein LOC111407980 isoform X1 n=1 Tax=Olea europaea var. sylvestris TaxID=158386 RepID=UPI000C1D2FF9|nr:uncharacterized protein LOC111407980 isoform X1 [Olea europaea var. sylvestris]
MKFDLEGTMDSMPEQGYGSDIEPCPAPLKRKKMADQGEKSQVAKVTLQPSDEPIKVAPIPRLGSSSCTLGECEGSPPNFGFPPTRGYREMEVLKSLVTPARAKLIAGRSADDIERAAAVYFQRVVAF